MQNRYKNYSRYVLFSLLLLLCLGVNAYATIRYVRSGGSGDGSTWAAASGNLQAMITASASGDEVWVAAGTYKPEALPENFPSGSATNRDWAFLLNDGVKVYGGFNPTGDPAFGERNAGTYLTVLSGEIGDQNTTDDNCYHVVLSVNDGATTLLDGFTVTGGKSPSFSGPYGGRVAYDGQYLYPAYAAGLYFLNSTMTVSNVIFRDLRAGEGGGAIYISIAPINFTGNDTHKGKPVKPARLTPPKPGEPKTPVEKPLRPTGGTPATASDLTPGPIITDCKFLNNSAQYYGGAVGLEYISNVSVKNCYFYQNSTEDGYGGGLYDYSNQDMIIDNCIFEENQGTEGTYGAGMYSGYSNTEIKNCAFTKNGNTSDSYGGAIYLDYSEGIKINHSTFTMNNAESYEGGAIYDYYSYEAFIDNCTFDGNTSGSDGGAIYSEGEDTEFTNCTFTNNKSEGYGGAINNYGYVTTITNCRFTKNSAASDGGGIYLYYGGTLDRCAFTENSADKGGGIYTYDPVTAHNSLFAKNTAASKGGGIYLNSSYTFNGVNCTIANNDAPSGGGIFNDEQTVTLKNSIVWGNTAATDPQYAGNNFTITYSDVQAASLVAGTGNLNTDPLFVDAANGNFSLSSCSPLINAGSNAAVTTSLDLAGNSRLFGVVDMGAYELQTPGSTVPTSNLIASQYDVCPNTEVTLNAQCSVPGATVNWNPGAPTVTPNAATVPYIYKASCTLNGCTGNESSVEVRTHRILVDMKDLGPGLLPLPIVRAVKDNMQPTNLIQEPTFPRRWTFIANGCDASESAVFKLSGPVNFMAIDNAATYAMFANDAGGFYSIDHPNYGNGGSFPNGSYTLTVDLRSANGMGGPFPKNRVATGSLLATRTLQFTVNNSGVREGAQESVAVQTPELSEEQWLSVGQNPVNTEVVVRLSGRVGQAVELSLTNLQGQTIQQRSVVLNSLQQYEVLNVAQAASGLYILKGLKENQAKTLKVVKMP